MSLQRNSRFIRSAICLAGLCLLEPQIAEAGDWGLAATTMERLDFNDNLRLLNPSPGYVFGSLTSLDVDADYAGHDRRFDFLAGASYQTYAGPGSAFSRPANFDHLGAKYNQKTKTDTYNFEVAYARQDSSSVDPLDPNTLASQFLINNFSANGSYGHEIDARNSLSLSASINRSVFDGAGAPDNFTTANLSAGWNYRLTKMADLKTSVFANQQWVEDAPLSRENAIGIREDLTTSLSHNIKLSIGGGPRLQESDQLLLPTSVRSYSSQLGWVGDASLSYTFKRGTLGASYSKTLDYSSLGVAEDRNSFGLSALYYINEISSLSTSLQWRNTHFSTGQDEAVLLFSPTYSYQMPQHWNMQLGYRFSLLTNAAASISSNDVYLSFSKQFVLER